MKVKLLLVVLIFSTFYIQAQSNKELADKYLKDRGELAFTFTATNFDEIKQLSSIISFDHGQNRINPLTIKAIANKKDFDRFLTFNLPFTVDIKLNEPKNVEMFSPKIQKKGISSKSAAYTLTFPLGAYPTYQQYSDQMTAFASEHSSIAELVDIGGTVQGVGGGDKRLLFIKLSDNVATREKEPRVMYTSSMHGDEIAGYPSMLNLIDYFIAAYEDVGHIDHARIKNLLDNSEVWINPLANPDATYWNDASNTTVANSRRANANNVDLNRNYPDNILGHHPDWISYELETQNFMALAESTHFVLSANFHGGTEVVNYPWDNTPVRHPDDAWYFLINKEYAVNCQNNSPNGYMDAMYTNYVWPGVTNGNDWYEVYGGRQDYMNFYEQCKETTIELSNVKTPPSTNTASDNEIIDIWNYNKEAYIEFLIQGTYGFQGVVKDAISGNPIKAKVTLVGHDALGSWVETELLLGDYYRPINAGTYDILYEAECYQSFTLTNQTIADYETKVLADIILTPVTSVPANLTASSITDTSATIGWDDAGVSSYDIQYRVNGSSTWISASSTTNSLNLTGLTLSTTYEFQVRSICLSTPSSYSSSALFTTTAVNYCDSSGGNIADEFIGRVQIGTIDNLSGSDGGYGDYTGLSVTFLKNELTTITITPTWTSTNRSEGYGVWVDYNKDGDFDDAGEEVWIKLKSKDTSVSGSFTIPATASLGSTRMRVSMRYNATPGSCDNGFDGEVEDYTVNITDSSTSLPPVSSCKNITVQLDGAGSATITPSQVDNGSSDDVAITNYSLDIDTFNCTNIGTPVSVTLTVTDANSQTDTCSATVTIQDSTPPIMTLAGSTPQTIEVNTGYTELGVSITDNCDIGLTPTIDATAVNIATVGSYSVTYNVTDVNGNVADQKTRTVNVVDTQNPVINLTGATPQIIEVGTGYSELGATVSDNYDTVFSLVIVSTAVNTAAVGSYSVTYNVTDVNGNVADQKTRTVNVVDTTKPVITLDGANPQIIEVGTGYSELGATVSDNYDTVFSLVIVFSAVNTAVVGGYSVTYNVTDANSNVAVEVIRTVNVVDTEKPVITLDGANPQVIEVGSIYSELGATVSDNYDTVFSLEIVSSAVNTTAVGSYSVTYNVSDANGNVANQKTRTVNVVDTQKPVINLTGANPQVIEVGTSYSELGATVSDNYDIGLTPTIDATGVNTSVVGIYNVTYNVTDANGNSAIEQTRTVNVVDTTKPVITLDGANPQVIEVGTGYSELGATVLDNYDKVFSLVIVSTSVNTAVVGSYSVTYNVTDANGNFAVEQTRTVNVVDTTKPVITLTGINPQVIEVGSSYSELGATVSDNCDTVFSLEIVSSAVNTAAVGSYSVTYNVSDANGNVANQKTRTVNVVDTQKPVINLTGANPQAIEVGTGYSELGATVSDNYDTVFSLVIVSTAVDIAAVGSYIVTYNVTDANGNVANQKTRTVNVVDTQKPVINLTGANPQVIEVGTGYSELGATVSDNYDTGLTPTIDATAVNTSAVGSYSVTYNVSDTKGNAAVEQTRTVNVVDTTKPVITLTGATPQVIEVGSIYSELGATVSDNYDTGLSATIDATAVNIAAVGSYSVTYNVNDANGNAATTVTRTVNVVDTTKPVITLTGVNPQVIEVGSIYSELGATVSDNYDTNLTATIDASKVNTAVVGEYTVTYNVADMGVNIATQVTRTVQVVLTLGIEDHIILDISIYPNPSSIDQITLKISNNIQEFEVLISNMLGQKVYTEQVRGLINNTHIINTRKLDAGIYFVTVKTEKGIGTKKMVIE